MKIKIEKTMKIALNHKIIILPIIEDLDIGDEVLLLISPEEIFIMLEPQESSVRNIFEGKIIEMGFQNEMVRVKIVIDEDMSLFVDITEYSRDKLGLNLGSNIFIGFKATSVPVIKI